MIMNLYFLGREDLHSLLDSMAEAKMRAVGLSRGREGTDEERGVFLYQYRRREIARR